MRSVFLIVAAVAGSVTSALAQSHTGTPFAPSAYPDARLVPRGVLRISFEPEYVTYDQVYDRAGNLLPLGASLSSDSAGADIFETAGPGENASRALSGLQAYRLSIGALTTERDADIRRFPFNFEFGLTSSLTVTASLPIVYTRAQVSLALDTTSANAGWNQALELSGAVGADQQFTTLISTLDGQAAFIEAQVAAGNYGCPTSQMCAQAQTVAVRAREMAMHVVTLSDAPFAPLSGSPAGQAILAAVVQLDRDMAAFGASLSTTTLPLPTSRLDDQAINELLGSDEGRYAVGPLAFVKYRQKLGDVELGVRWGAIRSSSVRAVVFGRARLPTGFRDSPTHLLDIGAGDRQTDLIGGFEIVIEPGDVLALALTGGYTLQLPDNLPRLLPSPAAAISKNGVETVRRDLGEVFQLSAYPSLRLNDAFTAYGSVHYFRKGADVFSIPTTTPLPGRVSSGTELGQLFASGTSIESLSFGAGVHYSPYGPPERMPIQAGIDYRATFRGEGGLAPKDVRLNFYLRLYYRLFGE